MTSQLKSIASALLLSTGLLLSCMHAAQAENQRCAKPVFYAQTANHKKEVEICIVTPSVLYSFGKTGATHKEMDITVPAARSNFNSSELHSSQLHTDFTGFLIISSSTQFNQSYPKSRTDVV
ncbi:MULTISPECIES: hypothetical protein [Citrobacter]|uniref:hypothetical protein n=1 Tax=Citrobacter TaxID=544 RepID=UPI0021CD1F50|nr:hypothetical protein [Citrobacter braakii]